MLTDIQISRAASLERISVIADRLGLEDAAVEPYGHYKAKIDLKASGLDAAPALWCWSPASTPRRRARARRQPPWASAMR
jgi:hypothetical protein